MKVKLKPAPIRVRTPRGSEVLGIVDKNLGQTRMLVICMDSFKRTCRVRGKMKKRIWIREGDWVIVSPWDFAYETKGDIIYRYTSGQAKWLKDKGYLKV